jgi:hypothetical protein
VEAQQLADEKYKLLQKALPFNEDWYEYGMFLLIVDTSCHSVKLTTMAFERAARAGGDVIEFLTDPYRPGSDEIVVDVAHGVLAKSSRTVN